MTWTPRFQEQLESLVLDNILAIIKRDMKAALDYFYVSENLPDFAQMTLGNFIRLAQPTLAIEPISGGGDETSGDFENQTLKVNIYLTVDDPDATEAARKLEKYMRALRAVLKSAKPSDYVVGCSNVAAFTPDLSWTYNQVAKDANQANSWLKSVTFDFRLRYIQR